MKSENNPSRANSSPYPLPQGEGFNGARFTEAAAKLAGMAGALLKWRPDEFWNATPEELAAIVRALTGEQAAAGRIDLTRLMEMFPDG